MSESENPKTKSETDANPVSGDQETTAKTVGAKPTGRAPKGGGKSPRRKARPTPGESKQTQAEDRPPEGDGNPPQRENSSPADGGNPPQREGRRPRGKARPAQEATIESQGEDGVAQGEGRHPQGGERPPEGEGNQAQGDPSRSKRRRRRPRRRRKGPGGGGGGPLIPVEGFLWIRDQGQPLLVDSASGFSPARDSAIAPQDVIQKYRLESGVRIEGQAKSGGDRPRLVEITAIEGRPPEEYREMAIPFSELTSIDPLERFQLETEPDVLEMRVSELIAPLGKGQRCLIVAPPKAGKTTLLQQMAHAIAVNHPETEIFVLLVDERPEEVTEWRRSVIRGEVYASSSDQSMESHVRLSEMVMERSRRLVEMGRDVIVFMDSLTRMSRAYNNMQKGSGRILSGGIDARTMERPRRHFGAARNVEHGGSLTIVATCLIDTGSRMDEVIFQEFKGTGNMELVLDRKLFEKRIFPCINIPQSGTRKEEKLYPKDQVEKMYLMRRALSTLSPAPAMELLLQKVGEFKNNAHFLSSLQLK